MGSAAGTDEVLVGTWFGADAEATGGSSDIAANGSAFVSADWAWSEHEVFTDAVAGAGAASLDASIVAAGAGSVAGTALGEFGEETVSGLVAVSSSSVGCGDAPSIARSPWSEVSAPSSASVGTELDIVEGSTPVDSTSSASFSG